MSQEVLPDLQGGSQQVVHIRSDSETKLDELFAAVIRPKEHPVPPTVPMRLRNLPPSFFRQPEKGSKSAALPIHHPRAHSSPASLQQHSKPPLPPQHARQRSHGDLLDDPLPAGWEMAKTAAGQTYFLNHLTQTTTWVDPRKKDLTSPVNIQNLGTLPKGWEQATTLEGEVYFINHHDRTTSWLDPRIPAHLQNPPTVNGSQNLSALPSHNATQTPSGISTNGLDHPAQSIKLPPSLAAVVSIQQRQQNLRVQSLEMEREQLRIRQQEIMRQQELLLRQSLGEKLTLASSPELPVLDGTTDLHSRQESADSGLGLYSLPHTPEDFLANLEDLEDRQSNDLGLDLQTNLDLGDDNMDTDDLVPSLQDELNADILSDVEALLAANKDSMLTWL